MLCAADVDWWNAYKVDALAFAGLKVTCNAGVPYRDVKLLHNSGPTGFDRNPSCVKSGGSSAHQAAHIAAHAGAARILLCGIDCHANDGCHHHGDHPVGLRNPKESTFSMWRRNWRLLGAELAARGIEVINCSLGSAVDAFPIRNIEEVLC